MHTYLPYLLTIWESIMHTYLPCLLTIWERVRTDVDRRPKTDEKIILTYDIYRVGREQSSYKVPAQKPSTGRILFFGPLCHTYLPYLLTIWNSVMHTYHTYLMGSSIMPYLLTILTLWDFLHIFYAAHRNPLLEGRRQCVST